MSNNIGFVTVKCVNCGHVNKIAVEFPQLGKPFKPEIFKCLSCRVENVCFDETKRKEDFNDYKRSDKMV